MNKKLYGDYLKILKEEMVPAMGCTEPISIAYAASIAKTYLKNKPTSMKAVCSGNIIKNVKCVTIPNTNGLIGIQAAAITGYVSGKMEKKMEVLEKVSKEELILIHKLYQANFCKVELLDTPLALAIELFLTNSNETVMVRITNEHTHINKIVYNNKIVYEDINNFGNNKEELTDRSCLNIKDILEFSKIVKIEEIKDLMKQQIEYNMAIANEGMNGEYGIGIGKVIKSSYPDTLLNDIKSCTAAASEARMCGCSLPVVTNSGSGNQGITCSVPIIIYSKKNNIKDESLYRALVFSNLVNIHEKTGIGRLSAFCGVVCASTAALSAITYLENGTYEQICETISNALSDYSGIICDGAKSTCAFKITTCIDGAYLAHMMAMQDKGYHCVGILKEDIEDTIKSVGKIGSEGMKQTDKTILGIMVE